MPATLVLPTTFEQSRDALDPNSSDYFAKLTQFVQPVEEAEREIVSVLSRMPAKTGRLLLLLGQTGCGKSTFVQSLTWRKHLGLKELKSIDCSELAADRRLTELLSVIQEECLRARERQGLSAISIDYLESLTGVSLPQRKDFFQTINGLLRKSPVLVVWPVTSNTDANLMLQEGRSVSSTLFDSIVPVLKFEGPKLEQFPSIARNTIAVFNQGSLLQDFFLTEAELETVRDDLIANTSTSPPIRKYAEAVYDHWSRKSGHLRRLTDKLPRPNEVWCVFCYPTAEDVVSSFATKGNHAPSAWIAYHAKLWEYVPDTQRMARWKNPTRLQFAISGAFTARVIHLSPQALIASCISYDSDGKFDSVKAQSPATWSEKSKAQDRLESSALFRQLVGSPPSKGKTKSGPAAEARKAAAAPFATLNKLVAGTGNDRYANTALAACLRNKLPKDYVVESERQHPWIPGLFPDIRVDTPDGRQICIEFCYTNNSKPSAVADYVLDKLATYMDQLELYAGVTASDA